MSFLASSGAGLLKMDSGFEDLELREAQREYLDFLDDDVNFLIYILYSLFLNSHNFMFFYVTFDRILCIFTIYSKTRVSIMKR